MIGASLGTKKSKMLTGKKMSKIPENEGVAEDSSSLHSEDLDDLLLDGPQDVNMESGAHSTNDPKHSEREKKNEPDFMKELESLGGV